MTMRIALITIRNIAHQIVSEQNLLRTFEAEPI